VVAGEKPTDTPSLADNAAEFKKLNDELFGDGSGFARLARAKCTQDKRPKPRSGR